MSASERFLYLYLFFLVHVVTIEETTAVCTKINDCECKKSNGNTMSLKPIDGTSGPKFPDIKGTKKGSEPGRSFTLSWNPCTKFSDDNCKNVLLCQKEGDDSYPVANEASAFQEESDGSITLTYTPVTFSKYTRIGVIKLMCDEDQYPGKLDPFVEVEDTGKTKGTYMATFHSKCVCDGGCSGGSAGLSPGSILLIVFFVLLLVYLIAGLLYKRYHKGVESLPEMFPNYSFWADFPFLIKDGCVFTFQGIAACCKRCCMKMKSDSYASI